MRSARLLLLWSHQERFLGYIQTLHQIVFFGGLNKHWDPNDPMYKAGNTWKDVMTLDPQWQTGAPVFLPGFGDGFQNQQLASDAECYLGKSKPQGYQRAPCQSEGVCLPGTSCYNCCAGDSGWACKKPWWE